MQWRSKLTSARKWISALTLFGCLGTMGCLSTPLGAQLEAQQAYDDCVEINGASRCEDEAGVAAQRRREMNERDLNRGDPNYGR